MLRGFVVQTSKGCGVGARTNEVRVVSEDATEDEVDGGAYALDVDSSMCASKDKRTKQTLVKEPEP